MAEAAERGEGEKHSEGERHNHQPASDCSTDAQPGDTGEAPHTHNFSCFVSLLSAYENQSMQTNLCYSLLQM